MKRYDALFFSDTWRGSNDFKKPNFLANYDCLSVQAGKHATTGGASGGLAIFFNRSSCFLVRILIRRHFFLRLLIKLKDEYAIISFIFWNPGTKHTDTRQDINNTLHDYGNNKIILGEEWNARIGFENS